MIEFVYKLFLGILVATTIGMGISTFYTGPTMPEYPSVPSQYANTEMPPAEQEKYDQDTRQYDARYERYADQNNDYQRNVAIIAIALSIIVLVVSLISLAKIDVLADGLLLGGVFTLLYGIFASFNSGDQKFIFVATLFGLVVALTLGYVKFVKPEQAAKAKRPKRKK